MTIEGNERIARNFPRRHTDVVLNVTETIPPEWILGHRISQIGDRVRKDMEGSLQP